MKNFRHLEIWKRSFNLAIDVYGLTDHLPVTEQYGLRSQINRSAVSIPSNIAEGCGRDSDKDLLRFLSIALGSAFELETQLLLMMTLHNIPEIESILTEVREIQQMISGYKKYLHSKE